MIHRLFRELLTDELTENNPLNKCEVRLVLVCRLVMYEFTFRVFFCPVEE